MRDYCEEIISARALLAEQLCNDAFSGSISARRGRRVWITPDGGRETLVAHDLVSFLLEEAHGDGASSDASVHVAVYQAANDASVVVHSRCPHVLALTFDDDIFVPADLDGRRHFPEVPVIALDPPDYDDRAPASVAAALTGSKACVVRGKGAFVAARSMRDACRLTCALEQSARVKWLKACAGS